MKRAFPFIPISLRRRSALTTAVVLLVTFLVALTIVWQAAGIRGGRQAILVRMQEETVNQMSIAGSGLNLTGLPSTNLLSNGSFTPDMVHAHVFAEEGAADHFDVKMSESQHRLPLTEDYYQGASFRLFRESLTEMTLIGSGQISGYEVGMVSGKREVSLPELPQGVRWQAFAESADGAAYIGGRAGALIKVDRDASSQRVPFRFPSDLTAMDAGAAGLIAGDAGGQFYASPDGLTWNLMASSASQGPIQAILYVDLPDYDNGFFLASGGPGELFFGHPSGLEKLSFPLEDRVTALVKTGDGLIYALGDRGQVAFSTNGISWQKDTLLSADQAWLAADAAGGVTLFCGKEGQMALRTDKGSVEHKALADYSQSLGYMLGEGQEGTWPDLVEVLMLSSIKHVVITSDGRLISSEDGGQTWSRENPLAEQGIERLKLLPSGDIYMARRDGKLIQAELTARLTFSPALKEDRVNPGDLMALGLSLPWGLDSRELEVPYREELPQAGEWMISGGASFVSGKDAAQGQIGQDSGAACALTYQAPLPGQADQRPAADSLFSVRKGTLAPLSINNPNRSYLNARLSQKLDLSRLLKQDTLPFYRLEFDIRLEGAIEGPIDVWFSGSLPDLGESISVQGDHWQHRRLALLFPRGLKMDDDLWLNIGFAGSGSLYLDNIWFGRSDDAPGALSSLLPSLEETGNLDVIRLDAVPIGRAGHWPEAWSLPEGIGCAGDFDACFHNLGAALQLVESRGAIPWLVVDLHASSEELAHLIEYLAGSPLTAYGKLRSRDGAIGRWTDAFNYLYIEITDGDQVLPNDASRANYVHWIMDQIQGAADFQAIRNKVFFVDAMPYDDGRSHTSADYHSSDFHPVGQLTNKDQLEGLVQAWVNQIPRGKMAGGLLVPELIRSMAFDGLEEPVRMVDIVATSLADLGQNSALVLLDINYADPAYLAGQDMASMALPSLEGLSGLRRLEEPVIIRQGLGGADHPLDESQAPLFYAFSLRGSTRFYALNLGQSSQIVSIQGMDRERDARFELYDHRGRVISQGIWKRSREDFTLLPGGVLLIRQEEESTP